RDACRMHGVSESYMSVAVKKIQQLSQSVAVMIVWYITSVT
ncbi:PapB/FocB family fimbrial expression transcriptional regulator, partial [Yokenella regensburgei]